MSGYYGASARAARRLVHAAAAGWPSPLRRAVQALLVLVAIVFVIAAWAGTTVLLVLTTVAGVFGRSETASRY